MSLSTRIQGLKKAVKRLEAAAGKGQKYCAHCRYMFRHSWPDPKRPKPLPEDVVTGKCEFCHSEYKLSIAGTPEDERDATRLHYSFTLEDLYTNPKAHALELWRETRRERKRAKTNHALAKKKVKNDPKVRALNRLAEEVGKLFEQKHKRLCAKYGDDPFPEHTQIIESVRNSARNKRETGVYAQGLFELEMEETDHLICAELEKIIWGETRLATKSAIERVRRQIDDLIRTTRESSERR